MSEEKASTNSRVFDWDWEEAERGLDWGDSDDEADCDVKTTAGKPAGFCGNVASRRVRFVLSKNECFVVPRKEYSSWGSWSENLDEDDCSDDESNSDCDLDLDADDYWEGSSAPVNSEWGQLPVWGQPTEKCTCTWGDEDDELYEDNKVDEGNTGNLPAVQHSKSDFPRKSVSAHLEGGESVEGATGSSAFMEGERILDSVEQSTKKKCRSSFSVDILLDNSDCRSNADWETELRMLIQEHKRSSRQETHPHTYPRLATRLAKP